MFHVSPFHHGLCPEECGNDGKAQTLEAPMDISEASALAFTASPAWGALGR